MISERIKRVQRVVFNFQAFLLPALDYSMYDEPNRNSFNTAITTIPGELVGPAPLTQRSFVLFRCHSRPLL